MWLIILLYTIALLALIIFGLISYARWNFGKLEKQNIPTVKPHHFLLGSALLPYEKPGGLLDIEHMHKYGPVFGIYNGREPQIVICDADLIRTVTTKDADYFDAKRELDFGDPLFNEMVEFLPGEKWKVVRNMITPILTNSLKIKSQTPAMRDAITDFVIEIKRQMRGIGVEGGRNKLEKFSLDESIFGVFTDLIARCQFSIYIGKSDLENRFVQLVKMVMTPPGGEAPWLATYVHAFPFLSKFLPNTLINPEPIKEYSAVLKQLVDTRRQQILSEEQSGLKHSPRDFIDHLVEWMDSLESEEFKKYNITEATIWSLGISLFIGGADQICLILGAMFYCISGNSEIERRVQDEVDRAFIKCNGVLDHETLSDLTYLNACITEATRMYPFFFRTERVCTKDWKDAERGFEIKKGDVVIIGIWAANRNPEYFENPDEFKPERFLPGNKELHPYAFTSYGFGRRNCVGKRFAIEVMQFIAAYLIKEFRFIRRSDSKIQFVPAGPFFGAHEPIHFDVELRSPSNKHEE